MGGGDARNSAEKTSTFFAAALSTFARKMKLNVSEKIAVGAASYVAAVFLIVAGGGPGYGQDNPAEAALDEARAREAVNERAQSGEQMIDTDRGQRKAGSEEAHHVTHSDGTGGAGVLNRISRETGVPVGTLQTEKSSTELGYGELEIANLLAKASGQRFDSIVAKFKAGEGWGKIAHDMGLNLGKVVSDANRPGSKNESKHLGQTNSEITSKPSIIPPPGGPRGDSILYTGITPIPSAAATGGAKSAPSATIAPRP